MYLNQVWDTAQKSLETTQSPCSGLLWSSAAERCSAVCLTGRRGKPRLWCQHHADVEPLCHTPPCHTNTDTVIYTHHSHLPQLVALSCLHPQQGSNAAMSNCHGHHYCHAVAITHTHTHTHLMALFLRQPRWADTRKVEPIWILLKQETVSGSGISRARCKSALAPDYSHANHAITPPLSFYRPDALPAARPTASKHWRHCSSYQFNLKIP